MKILLIFLPLIIGFLIGFFSKPDKWYFDLRKPYYNPPSYIFSIAWFILYILIGISYYLALGDLPYEYWIIPIIHLLLNFIYSNIVLFIVIYLLELESN